ncbi:MAG: hypothetical protein NG747_10780 [Candidatus Brocadia sp.]|nr:hypothetical protein [Candidatus Brocadia sp.]
MGTTGRQSNKAELFQFEKEAATCHIFVLAIVCFPIPDNAEFLEEFRPVPMRVLVHEALDTMDTRGRDPASTYCHGCFYDGEYYKWDGVKQKKCPDEFVSSTPGGELLRFF